MKKPRLTQRWLLTAVALALFVCSLLPGAVGRSVATVPHWLVTAALAPPGAAVTSVSHYLRPGKSRKLMEDSPARLREKYGEALRYNQKLLQENGRLKRENARLTQSRQRISLAHVRLVEARVTAYSGDGGNPTLNIDHGRRSGIAQRMVVVSGFNLVGTIVGAGPLTADVKLLTVPKTGVNVRIAPASPGASPRAMTAWITYDAKVGAFTFSPAIDKPVKVGDVAFLDDDSWPADAQGFVVGKVVGIEKNLKDPLNLKRVIIKPLRSLRRLARVTVLVPGD